jgi:hypothetical protein
MTVREPSAPSSDERAVNWPEAPAYSYRGLWVAGNMFIIGGLSFVALAGYMAVYSITVLDEHGRVVFGSTGVAAFGVFLMIVGILPAWGIPRLYPAIALSADGVFAYLEVMPCLKGKPWRFIGWDEIVSITRHTNMTKGTPRPYLAIEGQRYTIKVHEFIGRYADLRECLTRYARDHGVLLRPWRDWSRPSDSAER